MKVFVQRVTSALKGGLGGNNILCPLYHVKGQLCLNQAAALLGHQVCQCLDLELLSLQDCGKFVCVFLFVVVFNEMPSS